MSYTIQDYQRDYVRDHLDLLTADDLLDKLSPDVIKLLMQKIGMH